jgi:hypothetical protein
VRWQLSSSSDPRALHVLDGWGQHYGAGAHYSRRTPGSATFTGVGQEVVLVTVCGRAVWACIRQRTPQARGSGGSRGREGSAAERPFVWRNNVFRNLGAGLSSELIREAVALTGREWKRRYGALPPERLRTEVDVTRVRSTNPGFCYIIAGWERGGVRRGTLFLHAPPTEEWGC